MTQFRNHPNNNNSWKLLEETKLRPKASIGMATSLCASTYSLKLNFYTAHSHKLNAKSSVHYSPRFGTATRICCASNNFNDDNVSKQQRPQSEAIQVYTQIERFFPKILYFFLHVTRWKKFNQNFVIWYLRFSVMYPSGFLF